MKSKELIRLLQEEDPGGETEVSIGNHDILSVHTEPACWDGRLQLLVRDPAKAPYYDVVGARYVSSGNKIVLTSMGVSDVLWESPDAEIDYSDCGGSEERYRKTDDATRQASRDVELKVEMDAFHDWVRKKAAGIRPQEDCRHAADHFYEGNLSPKDPVKDLPPRVEGNLQWHPSWAERREAWWDDTISVRWEGGWEITRKPDGEEH